MTLRVGIDIGGTFTDFVIFDPSTNELVSFKLPSSPSNPSLAILEGIEIIEKEYASRFSVEQAHGLFLDISHGSTVATNALLERKGAKTALVTTAGFKDVLEIGRQNRRDLYALGPQKPKPIIPDELRFTAQERVLHDGSITTPLSADEVHKIAEKVRDSQAESVAVSLIFSFANPVHERQIADALAALSIPVSCSADILPEFREYERTSTTVINAYVSPIMKRYIEYVEGKLCGKNIRMQIMQSNGGSISLETAKREGVRCILSGPAGGAIAAAYVSSLVRNAEPAASDTGGKTPLNMLTFDMGGTSTDVSLIVEKPTITTDASIGGYPIHIPLIDIHTIGAGGGSIAYLDEGKSLRVGPQSAGADPGPACYGRSDLPTVTDANVVLGRIIPDYFLAGKLTLEKQKSIDALNALGNEIGISVEELAEGIIDIANTHMGRALRLISIEQGYDPKMFSLLSFGGAGGLHATDLARNLQVPRVIIPPLASTFSAFGMLVANVVKDYTKTVMLTERLPFESLQKAFLPLLELGARELMREGFSVDDITLEKSLDARYAGQSYEINVPFSENWEVSFHQAHEKKYGFYQENTPIEVVNIRVRAIGLVEPPVLEKHALLAETETPDDNGLIEKRNVIIDHQSILTPVFDGEQLKPGQRISGPALIVRKDTTILLKKDDDAAVDAYFNLLIDVRTDGKE